jgi:hypothetical protein
MITATTPPRFDTKLDEATPLDFEPAVSARITWWGAILAGAFAAISLQVIFAVLGTAIGLSVLGAADDTAEKGLGVGAAIYWLITGLVSLFIGGWIASYLRRTGEPGIGAIHGLLAWCTVTVLSTVLLTMAGGAAIGGSLAAVGDSFTMNNQSSAQPESSALSSADRVSEEDAKQAAKKAAAASWWTLVALVLGATVASLGGSAAVRNYADDRRATRHVQTACKT